MPIFLSTAMISSLTAVVLPALIYALHVLFSRFTRPSLSMIRGPKSPSFIFGNLLELFQRPVGEADFTWHRLYGNVVRFKGVFGEDYLLITDPKALQKMLNTSAYDYPKLPNLRVISQMLNGKGILWADGEAHKRQRKVMLPGFGLRESRALLPIFKECAESLSIQWLETIGNSASQNIVLDVRAWLSRGTLDAIGQAAFDIQFNTIRDNSHPLGKVYKNHLGAIFGLPSAKQIFIQGASKPVPTRILQWIADHGSNPRLARARHGKSVATDIAKKLIREKADALLQGKGSRDVFTLLVKANMDADARNKLTEEELLAQIRTLLSAGHETTANTIGWILLELARNTKIQSRLRDEIKKAEATIQARGDPQLTVADLDSMPYFNAVIKEGLRFHPTAPHVQRMAYRDDVLPLSKPILTQDERMINEVLVPKGTHIVISISAYNRDKDLWGEDAHEFNPDRWLDGALGERRSTSIGVYSNLLSFLSGTRACLGWRFAVIEIQVFLLELVGKFEFTMSDKGERVLRQLAAVMVPMVDGELDRGVQLPLAVSLAPQDG